MTRPSANTRNNQQSQKERTTMENAFRIVPGLVHAMNNNSRGMLAATSKKLRANVREHTKVIDVDCSDNTCAKALDTKLKTTSKNVTELVIHNFALWAKSTQYRDNTAAVLEVLRVSKHIFKKVTLKLRMTTDGRLHGDLLPFSQTRLYGLRKALGENFVNHVEDLTVMYSFKRFNYEEEEAHFYGHDISAIDLLCFKNLTRLVLNTPGMYIIQNEFHYQNEPYNGIKTIPLKELHINAWVPRCLGLLLSLGKETLESASAKGEGLEEYIGDFKAISMPRLEKLSLNSSMIRRFTNEDHELEEYNREDCVRVWFKLALNRNFFRRFPSLRDLKLRQWDCVDVGDPANFPKQLRVEMQDCRLGESTLVIGRN